MNNSESTLLQQCKELLEPLRARARQGDVTAINPTEEGAAIVAALAVKFRDIPMPDPMLDVVYLIPSDKWPEGLSDKVEQLLDQIE